MNTTARRAIATAGALLTVLIVALPAQAKHVKGDVIIEWNAIAQRSTFGPPFPQARIHAMVQIAMADAVVAIEGKYEPFYAKVPASANANAKAAAAQAAHDILVATIPSGTAGFDAALEASLAGLPANGLQEGRRVGRKVAAKILAWRQFDGLSAANPQPSPLLPSQLPGIWQQTGSGPALFAAYGDVLPFGLVSSTQFLPAPMPQLDSAAYAADFNDVKLLGAVDSAARTERQTMLAKFIASAPGETDNVTNPLRVWHNVVADTARSQNLSLVGTARLFALVTASIHDSLQTSHASKFVYRLWRPVTAVINADIDDNADTVADPNWQPLLFTPPYPSHASNAACIGTGAARMLANVLGNDAIPFEAKWYATNDATEPLHVEPYGSFSAFAYDFGSSRVWGGIHFRFEIDASEVSCTQVADYIFDTRMRHAPHGH